VVHGDGQQTRDYVYVDDVVDAMITAGNNPDVNQMVVNVGSGTETSVRDLVRQVVDITGANPEVVYNPKIGGGVSRMCADVSLAEQTLHYRPKVSLDTGLRRTIDRETWGK
jgi:UDP-glucose 4-epimerase